MTNLHGLAIVLLPILGIVSVTGSGLLFKHMANNGDTEFLPKCDDCNKDYNTTHPYKVYGESYNRIFVGANGHVTFGKGFTAFLPQSIPFVDTVMVAPYWSDNFPPAGVPRSHIWYREETEDETLLEKAQKVIEDHFGDCGYNFKPTALFIVTWSRQTSLCEFFDTEDNDLGIDNFELEYIPEKRSSYLGESLSNKENNQRRPIAVEDLKQNSYQLVLATDGCDTYAIFNMHTIEWTYCLGDSQMRFNAGDGIRSYAHPDPTASGLVDDSNVGLDGRWAYKISGKHVLGPDCEKP